jgi:hypothetical protein
MNIRRGAHAALDRDTLAKRGELKHSVDISIQLYALVWALRRIRSVGISVVDLFRLDVGNRRSTAHVQWSEVVAPLGLLIKPTYLTMAIHG